MLEIKNKQLQIGIFETSSQNKSILEFFFKNAGKSVFKEALLDECSAIIVDYDYPGAKDKWEETYNLTQKPGIIISIKEIDLPSTIWVSKPISSQALLDAGIKLQELLEENSLKESSEAQLMTNSVENEIKKEDSSLDARDYDISIEEFNAVPENTEIAEKSHEDATALLDSLSLDDNELESDDDSDTNKNNQLAEATSEPVLFNTHDDYSDSVIDDVINIEENKDDYHVSLEQSDNEEFSITDSSDLEIFLEDDAPQFESVDENFEENESLSEANIENEKEDSPPIGEVDSLLESLIEQNDEEEANQIELIDVEDHTSSNSIIMAEEEETLPIELAGLSMAYEENAMFFYKEFVILNR